MNTEPFKLEPVTKDTIICDQRVLRVCKEIIWECLGKRSFADDLETAIADLKDGKFDEYDDLKEEIAKDLSALPYLIDSLESDLTAYNVAKDALEHQTQWAEDYVKSDDYNSEYSYLVKDSWGTGASHALERWFKTECWAELKKEHKLRIDQNALLEAFDDLCAEHYELNGPDNIDVCDEYSGVVKEEYGCCLDSFTTGDYEDQLCFSDLFRNIENITFEQFKRFLPALTDEFCLSCTKHITDEHSCFYLTTNVGVRADYELTSETLHRIHRQALRQLLTTRTLYLD